MFDVVSVYNQIAASFDRTRVSHWDRVAQFIRELPAKSRLGDIGCGNGKYFDVRTDIEIMACDASEKLVNIAWDRVHHKRYTHVEIYQADVRKIPILSDFLDAAICVAVLHHLPSPEERLQAVLELYRIIRPGGCLLFTMWAEVNMESRKETKKWIAQERKGDYLIPWTLHEDGSGDSRVLYRYYHLMGEYEAEQMRVDIKDALEKQGMEAYVDFELDANNWNFILTKPRTCK